MNFKQKNDYALISECGRYQIAKMNTGTEMKYLAFAHQGRIEYGEKKLDIVGEAVTSWQEAREMLIKFDKGEE